MCEIQERLRENERQSYNISGKIDAARTEMGILESFGWY